MPRLVKISAKAKIQSRISKAFTKSHAPVAMMTIPNAMLARLIVFEMSKFGRFLPEQLSSKIFSAVGDVERRLII